MKKRLEQPKFGMKLSLAEQLRFERLLTNIFSRFVSIPADKLDSEIQIAQMQLCSFLNIELCVLWQLSPDSQSLHLSHIHAPPNFRSIPDVLDAKEYFPWFLKKMLSNEPIIAHQIDDLPSSAHKDRDGWKYYGIKSSLTFPLSAGGGAVFGSLTFCVLNKERSWSEDLVSRLKLVSQIFSSALARKRADQALMESEARLSLAAEAAQAGLWILDRKTGCFWATELARKVFSFTADEEIGFDKFVRAVHPDDRDRIVQKVEASFTDGLEYREEYRICSLAGADKWVFARGRLMPEKPECLMGVVIDITERRKSEMESRKLRGELTHVSRIGTLNQLAVSLAHEVNQPLAAILNNAETALQLLKKKKNDLKAIRGVLNEIVRDDIRASKVIQQLRALSRKQEREYRDVNVVDLIYETIRFVQSDALLRGKTISYTGANQLPLVYGDRIQLQQVLINLITNGLEAMVDTELGRSALIVKGEKRGRNVIISVCDSGSGINEKQFEHLFEPFYTTKKSGLGMGLPISRAIVEDHGGELKAENNADGGARFFFSIPGIIRSKK